MGDPMDAPRHFAAVPRAIPALARRYSYANAGIASEKRQKGQAAPSRLNDRRLIA